MNQFHLFQIPPKQKSFSTKEVMEITGFTKEALRYYEKLAILGPIARNQANYRQYNTANLQRLQMVKVFQYLAMDLSMLKDLSESDSLEKHLEVLRSYQRTVHEQMTQLQEIDHFIENKIDYLINNHSKN
ncbi:MerR family transcriptional regulator [Enterococcus sp. 2201sp1_2201st1_B8_2201SCRN_220225]|uniref:MerR family transcriptional regulator n=1 Tax=unclassified Enterococcus TaxID=2608891 RepID=UPI0034A30949